MQSWSIFRIYFFNFCLKILFVFCILLKRSQHKSLGTYIKSHITTDTTLIPKRGNFWGTLDGSLICGGNLILDYTRRSGWPLQDLCVESPKPIRSCGVTITHYTRGLESMFLISGFQMQNITLKLLFD